MTVLSTPTLRAFLQGDIDRLIRLTCKGEPFEYQLEVLLRNSMTKGIVAGLKQFVGEEVRHPALNSLRLKLEKQLTAKTISFNNISAMTILLMARVAINVCKGIAIGTGMWLVEWWMARRVHPLLKVEVDLPVFLDILRQRILFHFQN